MYMLSPHPDLDLDPEPHSERSRTLLVPTGTGDLVLPLAWLRDSCACTRCRHTSGQRPLDPAGIADDPRPSEVDLDGDMLAVTWGSDGHRSTYSIARCREALAGPLVPRRPATWDATAAGDLAVSTHAAITGDPHARLEWLRGVAEMGCGLLHDVPVVHGEVARVAELFAHVRTTNYGRWFDVRSIVDPSNLANTSLGLAAHTDNPYRDPVPTMQLLHCLASSAQGGENVLVDGWRVADEVRHRAPRGFDLLTRRGVAFEYRDPGAVLRTVAPIVELDTVGRVRSVRFNARSMQPPSMPADELVDWYDAYLLFARLLADPSYQLQFRLEPGDLFVVDNRRVLHGRTGFAAEAGTRHLQGCYADVDGLHSTIAVLARELGAVAQ